jgi:hypothetical protein
MSALPGHRGLLLTQTEPPPAMEAEFNAWYDLEHLPERLSIAGFRSARRWVADRARREAAHLPKYFATYELDSLAVLSSPEYLRYFERPTPWSKRCLDACVVFKRWACEQLGALDPHPAARALIVSLDGRVPQGKTLQVRRFRAQSGETIALYEFDYLPSDGYRLYQA